MKCKVKSVLSLFAAVVLLMPFILEAAGTIELPQTGQTKCYDTSGAEIVCTDTGQDGDIRTGVVWPDPRFTDNGDETISDNLTGLVWAKNGNLMAARDIGFDTDGTSGDGRVTWQHALDYVAKLNAEDYLGYNDWRLPNVNELGSLINSDEADTSADLNAQSFSNAQSYYYWSSSTYAFYTTYAWYVGMGDGYVAYSYKGNDNYVWPVRSGFGSSVISLPKTGQTKCYNEAGTEITCEGTGQDGDIQAGIAWPSPRFTDNGNETVTDNLTGLMWTKNANLPNGQKTWQEALDYIASLNSSNYLGFNDWHLPNVNQLRSLANAGELHTSSWLNTQGFSNVQSDFYWSSSTYAYDTDYSWYVYMYDGYVGSLGKDYYYYVWPVSSGQVVSLTPSVISSSPNSGVQGETLDVTISGANFTDAESISFGSGITVAFYTVVSDTVITANITIDLSATAGVRDIVITTTNGTGTLSSGFTVTPPGKLPDLTVSSVSFKGNAKKGKKINITAVIKNIGEKNALNSSVKFYLSSNNTSSIDGDTPIGPKKATGKIKVKGRVTVKLIWKVKAPSGAGDYYLKAVCDSGSVVTESNESNNIKASKKISIK